MIDFHSVATCCMIGPSRFDCNRMIGAKACFGRFVEENKRKHIPNRIKHIFFLDKCNMVE